MSNISFFFFLLDSYDSLISFVLETFLALLSIDELMSLSSISADSSLAISQVSYWCWTLAKDLGWFVNNSVAMFLSQLISSLVLVISCWPFDFLLGVLISCWLLLCCPFNFLLAFSCVWWWHWLLSPNLCCFCSFHFHFLLAFSCVCMDDGPLKWFHA